jgi:hypothetical protein
MKICWLVGLVVMVVLRINVVKDSWGRQVWMLCANCKHDWDNRKAIRKEWVDAQLVL